MFDLAGLSRLHRCSRLKAFDGEWGPRNAELCLDGERLIPLAGTTDLQTASGEIKVVTSAARHTAYRKDGSTIEFGFALGGPASPEVFHESAREDAFGNRMSISYHPDGRPLEIAYASNSALSLRANRFVDFEYEAANNPSSRGLGGILIENVYRLKSVTMAAPANLEGPVKIVRQYRLTYGGSDVLHKISECFPTAHSFDRHSAPSVVCREPIVFDRPVAPVSFQAKTSLLGDFPQVLDERWDTTWQRVTTAFFQSLQQKHLASLAALDADGDDVLDLVYLKPTTPYAEHGICKYSYSFGILTQHPQARWFIRKGRLSGAGVSFEAERDLGFGDVSLENFELPPRAIDFNGDGVAEVLVGNTRSCPLSVGHVSVPWPARHLTLGVYSGQQQVMDTAATSLVGDLNGDGLPDLVGPDSDLMTQTVPMAFSGVLSARMNRSSPPGFSFDPLRAALPASPCHEPSLQTALPTTCFDGAPCDKCGTDNAVREIPFHLGCESGGCVVTSYQFLSGPDSAATFASRVSSLKQSALTDLDGNGRLELIYREAVQAHRVHFVLNGFTGVHITRFSAIDSNGTGFDDGELPGARLYSMDFGSSGFTRRVLAADSFPQAYKNVEPVRFVDLNGDDLPDWYSPRSGVLAVRLNTGAGFGAPIEFDLTTTQLPNGVVDPPGVYPFAQFGDVDGDGRPEVLMRSGRVFDLAGLRWREKSAALPLGAGQVFYVLRNGSPASIPVPSESTRFVDLNADGLVDVLGIDSFEATSFPDGHATLFHALNSTRRPVVTSVSQGSNSTSIETQLFRESFRACALPQTCATPDGLTVVTRTTSTGPFGAGVVADYTYSGSRTDVLGHGWLGFETRTVTSRGVTRAETFGISLADRKFGSGTCSSCYWYPGSRRPSRIETRRDSRGLSRTGAGQQVLTVELFEYVDERFEGHTPGRSYLAQALFTESAGAVAAGQAVAPSLTAARSSRGTFVRVRGTETLRRLEVWEGAADTSGGPPASVQAKRTETRAILVPDDTSRWFIALPRRLVTSSKWPNSAQVTRTVEFEYEQSQPILKAAIIEPDSNTVESATTSGFRAKTELVRHRSGAVTSINQTADVALFDQAGRTTQTRPATLEYDADFTFPRSVRNPLGYLTTVFYLPSTGAVAASSVDLGGSTFDVRRDYDTSGREVGRRDSSGARLRSSYLPGRIEVVDDETGVSVASFDEFDRVVREDWPGWNGKTNSRTYSYDSFGRLQNISLPYSGARPRDFETVDFDALGRIVRQANSATQQSEAYSYAPRGSAGVAWQTTISLSSGGELVVGTDGTGAQVHEREKLTEATGSQPASWNEQRMAYGAFGLLSELSEGTRSTTFEYDALGRRTRIVDQDSGTREERYNAFSELVRSASPLAVVEYARDQLSRVTRRRTTRAGSAATEATFVWDTGAHGVGQLSRTTSDTGVVHDFTYRVGGALAEEGWTVGGQRYAASMDYDAFSRLSTLTYPSFDGSRRAKVRYFYAADGSVARVEDVAGVNPTRVFWSALERNAGGLPTRTLSGAGLDLFGSTRSVMSVNTYDSAYRLSHRKVTDGFGRTVLALKYEYDLRGLSRRHDRSDPTNLISEEFSHDVAGRLTDWFVHQGEGGGTCRVATHKRFRYSDSGNLEREEFLDATGNTIGPVVRATYGGAVGPTAMATRDDSGVLASFAYDAEGNQEAQTVAGVVERSASYNHRGQFLNVATQGGSWRMDYEAFGERVRVQRLSSGGTPIAGQESLELGGLAELHPGGRSSFNVVVDNEVVAVISRQNSQSEVRYVHNDLLGSPSAMTAEATGAIVDRPHYSPFGERRESRDLNVRSWSPHAESIGFAAQRPDDEFSTLQFRARAYDPHTARFLSPDPLVGTGQAFNAYSYAINSPVNRIDPSGMFSCIATNGGGSVYDCGGSGAWSSSSGPMLMPSSMTAGEQSFMGAVGSLGALRPVAVDDTNRTEPTRATAGQAAGSFAKGFGMGLGVGVATAYGLGVVSAACPPCAIGIGVGLLAYGVYGLVNGGAAAIVESGSRIVAGEGTVEDFELAGNLTGGVVAARVGAQAFRSGVADGRALRGRLASGGVVRMGSGMGGSAPANIVRTIARGERVADIVAEGKALTFATGNEHALVSLANGERVLVSGGPTGIDLSGLPIRRLIGHSHPYHLAPTGPSAADFGALGRLGQRSSYLLEHGDLTRFWRGGR